ncbi:unannotated protein [freshwater metagenome]|uniref:Unannotated protein n=1 Tax=freshwater metagenome TaxID=449393 RepID=A0A6J7S8B9_9ZZZZ
MGLHDLVHPFRIEQVGEAFWRFFRLHHIGVVANDAAPGAEAGEHAIRILVLGGIVFGDVFRNVRLQNAVPLPDDEVRSVRGIHHVNFINLAGVFLPDALEHALGAAAFNPDRDAGIFRLEGLADFFRYGKIDSGVPDDLPFLLGRINQLLIDHSRRRCLCADGRCKDACSRERCRPFQNVSPRNSPLAHGRILPVGFPLCGPFFVAPGFFIPSALGNSPVAAQATRLSPAECFLLQR